MFGPVLRPVFGNFSTFCHNFYLFNFIFFFLDFIYLSLTDPEREAETQAEGEAGSLRGARCGTRSRALGSRPGPEADAQLLSHPGAPG